MKIFKKIFKVAVFLAVCFIVGIIIGILTSNSATENDDGNGAGFFLRVFVIAVAYLPIALLNIVIHEAGHLLFGLMSGYKFSSFRVMSFMWLKDNGRIKFCRLSIAGTGGQCLMSPPDLVDGRIPAVAYNLGGSILNIIFGIIFFVLAIITSPIELLSLVFLVAAIISFVFAALNGIPMRMKMIDNDGYNAFSLRKDKKALKAFWVQMKVNELISRGVRLKDMPDEMFEMPADEDMKNSLVASSGVFACSRMLDLLQFDEAKAAIDHLLAIKSGLPELYRNLLVADRIYLELITDADRGKVDSLYTDAQKQFMRSMRKFPTVFRTEYTYALLYSNDREAADIANQGFENMAKSYPYKCDIISERELIDIATDVYIKRNNQ